MPELGKGRHLGQQAIALHARCGEHAQLAAPDMRDERRRGVEHHLHAAADQIGHRGSASLVWHVHERRAGHALEELARHVRRAAAAGRGEVDGVRLGVGDQLVHVARRQLGVHRHDQRQQRESRHRGEILHRVVGQLLEEMRPDAVRGDRVLQQRVAIR